MIRFFVGAVFLGTATFALQIGEEVGDEHPPDEPRYGGYGLGGRGGYGRASHGGHGYHHAGYVRGRYEFHSLKEEKADMPQPAGAGTKDAELTDAPAPVASMEVPLDARASEELADERPAWGRGYGVGGYGYGGGGFAHGGYGGIGPYGNGVGPYGNGGFNGPAVHTVVHHPRPAQAVTHVYHSLNEENPDMPQPAGASTNDAELTDAPAPVESMEAPLDARASEELADEQPAWGRGYGVGGYGYVGGGFAHGGYGGIGPYGNGVGPYGNGGFNGPAVHTVVHHPRPAQAVMHVYHSRNEEEEEEVEE